MTEQFEFEMCCGTLCDKPLAMRQVKHLQTLFDELLTAKMLPADVGTLSTTTCKLVVNGEVVGVFVPQSVVDTLRGDSFSAEI